MEFTKEQKKEAYKNLTDEQKEYVGSEKLTNSIQEIGRDYNLLLDKVGKLNDIIFLSLIGLVKISDLRYVLGKI
jgi:hypothetical protein